MKYIKKMVGKKCYLSPIQPGDAELLAEWRNDIEVGINTGDATEMISGDNQQHYIESLTQSGYGFLIVDHNGDEPIGFCKLTKVDMLHRNASMGIIIGNRKNRKKGIGTEAIHLLLDFGFHMLNLNNIMLKVFSFNTHAISVYNKCGFKEIGRRRSCVTIGGKRYDDVYMDMLAEEFTNLGDVSLRNILAGTS